MKTFKKFVSVILMLSMCFVLLTNTAVFAEPVVTRTAADITAVYNSLDEKVFTEYNNWATTQMNQYNYMLGTKSGNKLVLYVKYDISSMDLADANISSAGIYQYLNGNHANKTMKVYALDNALWSDTVGPVVDRSEDNTVATYKVPAKDDMAYFTDSDISNTNTFYDMTEYIKQAVADGETTLCFVIESTSNDTYGSAGSSSNKPTLMITTTTNKVPVVTAIADKDYYDEGESAVITATATDEDGDELTYSFKVDGTESTNTDGNVLTIENLTSGTHTIEVLCSDGYDTGKTTIEIFVKGSPVKTWNSANSTVINSYDGKTVSEYNNSTHFSSPYNYMLGGDAAKPIMLYMRFNISSLGINALNIADANIAMWIQSANHCGKILNIYALDSAQWNTTIAPVVDRDNNKLTSIQVPATALVNYADTDPIYSYAAGKNIIFGDTDAETPDYAITDYVKKQVSKGENVLCFAVERESAGYSTTSKTNLPVLNIRTTTNNAPMVTLSADKDVYEEGETMTVTADAYDEDEGSEITSYEFYVDGVLDDSSVDNTLALICDGNKKEVTVRCYDEWGDYGMASIVVGNTSLLEAAATVSGTVTSGDTLTASYRVENHSSDTDVDFALIIAVYDANDTLYDMTFKTCTLEANGKDNFEAEYVLPSDVDLTDYTAHAYIWELDSHAAIADFVSFN